MTRMRRVSLFSPRTLAALASGALAGTFLVWLPLSSGGGCSCESAYLVPLDEAELAALRLESESELPRARCDVLCARQDEGDGAPVEKASDYGFDVYFCQAVRGDDAEPALLCKGTQRGSCIGGRRPEALAEARVVGGGPGASLAAQAHLEAASVPAFVRLAAELSVHGAPRSLVRAALESARDEVRHARVIARLAAREGARTVPTLVTLGAPRALAEVLRENTVEGTVREAWGARVARMQGARAEGSLGRALAHVAVEEERHASLARAIDAWGEPSLARAQRALRDEAREAAFEALRAEVQGDRRSAETHAALGLPSPDEHERLLSASRDTLLS
jgi:hypothetical protein